MAVAEHHHVKKKRDPETHYFATELDGPPVREVTAPKSTDDDDDGGGGGGGEAASQSSSRAAAPSPAPDAATDDLLGESSGSSKPASPAVSAVPFTGTGAEAATPSPLPPAAAPSTHIARLQAANRKIESQLASLRNVLARIDEKPGGSPRKPRPQGYSSADPASSLEAVAKQTARYKRENEVLSERLKSPTEGGGLSDLHHLVAARDEEARNLRIRLKRLQAGLKRVEKTLASASEGSLEGTVDKAKVGAKAVEDVLRQRLARVKESRQREQQVVQQQTAVLATLRTAISTEKYPSVDVKGLKDLERDLEERAKQIAAANAQLVIVRRSKESEKDRLRWCIRDKREEERMLGAQLSRIEHTLQSKQAAGSDARVEASLCRNDKEHRA
ncbi:hypothetical protein DIPPA_03687 [Diplonema papillatum]|nr:hypothetical protein DIPPA_03687 [Diplonema papillatum]